MAGGSALNSLRLRRAAAVLDDDEDDDDSEWSDDDEEIEIEEKGEKKKKEHKAFQLPTKAKASVEKTADDAFITIVSLQQASGAWPLDVAVARLVSKSVKDLDALSPFGKGSSALCCVQEHLGNGHRSDLAGGHVRKLQRRNGS